MYLGYFWKILPSIFTFDFWRVNKIVRKKKRFGCIYSLEEDLYIIKKWAKKHGYTWDNTWYLDGERYLLKNNVPVCMIQPMFPRKLTRNMAHQPDYADKIVNKNHVFLLNHNKTANALFEALNAEQEILFKRDKLCEKINHKVAKEKTKYTKSDEFIYDLAELSFENYYDILALKNNTTLSVKEKKQYIGDYCEYDQVYLKDYLSWEEFEELEVKGKEYNWCWTGDYIPTALTRGAIDSVICINPDKIYNVKVTPDILKRLHKIYFNGLPTKRKI